MNKFFGVLLAVFVSCLIASPVHGVLYPGVCTIGNCTYTLDADKKVLSVSGTSIGEEEFHSYCASYFGGYVTRVNIADSIQTIGDDVFYGCYEIKKVCFSGTSQPTCGDGVFPYLLSSGDNAFHVDVPEGYPESAKFCGFDVDRDGSCKDSCPEHCECNENGECIGCEDGLYLKDGACVDECGEGYYLDESDGQCVACPEGCTKCNENGCICTKGGDCTYTFDTVNNVLSVSGTSIGEDEFDNFCRSKSVNRVNIDASIQSIGTGSFDSCMSLSFVCYLGFSEPTCSGAFYHTFSKAYVPESYPESAQFCGFEVTHDESCKPSCPEHCECNENDECIGCEDDFYLKNGICVDECGEGYYLDESGGRCIACTEGCTECNESGCIVCEDDYVLEEGTCRGFYINPLFRRSFNVKFSWKEFYGVLSDDVLIATTDGRGHLFRSDIIGIGGKPYVSQIGDCYEKSDHPSPNSYCFDYFYENCDGLCRYEFTTKEKNYDCDDGTGNTNCIRYSRDDRSPKYVIVNSSGIVIAAEFGNVAVKPQYNAPPTSLKSIYSICGLGEGKYYLKDDGTPGSCTDFDSKCIACDLDEGCSKCEDGYYVDDNGECQVCTATHCAAGCRSDGKCSQCDTGYTGGLCEEACESTIYFGLP